MHKTVRYRTVGDGSCTGAVESAAADGRRDHRRGHGVAAHRARRHAGRRPAVRGRHGRPQAGGLLLMGRDLLRLRDGGLGGRRQVHPGRAAAVRHQVGARRPDRGRAPRARWTRASRRPTCRCWSTACAPSASRASRSTSPTATSPRRSASSCSPTPPATSSTPATPSPARPPRSWRCCWSTPATAWSSRPAATPRCSRCCACRGSCWRSTRSTWSTTTRRVLTAIAKEFAGLATSLGFTDDAVATIPVSALLGDNVVERSAHTPWYDGPDAARPPGVRAGRRARGQRAVPASRCST